MLYRECAAGYPWLPSSLWPLSPLKQNSLLWTECDGVLVFVSNIYKRIIILLWFYCSGVTSVMVQEMGTIHRFFFSFWFFCAYVGMDSRTGIFDSFSLWTTDIRHPPQLIVASETPPNFKSALLFSGQLLYKLKAWAVFHLLLTSLSDVFSI